MTFLGRSLPVAVKRLPGGCAQYSRMYGGMRYGGPSRTFDGRPLPVNTVVKFVPQQQAWVVERFGKFHRILEPGLAVLAPVIDQIRYVKTLKEVAVEIPSQAAITQDNVTINMDGVLYYRVIDPFKVPPPCSGLRNRNCARHATEWRMRTLPLPSSPRRPCGLKLAS